jgi:hypothetical protein
MGLASLRFPSLVTVHRPALSLKVPIAAAPPPRRMYTRVEARTCLHGMISPLPAHAFVACIINLCNSAAAQTSSYKNS